MKNALFLLFLLTINSQSSFAQGEKRSPGEPEVKKISFNYETKSFTNDVIFSNLKIGDWVQIFITNLPDSVSCAADAEFTNSNLELREQFGSFLTFDNKNQYAYSQKEAADPKAIEKKEEEVKKALEDDDKKIEAKNIAKSAKENNIVISDPKRKMNDATMVKDLEISIAENFIKNQTDADNTNRKKALEDIEYQKRLIKIHVNNIRDRIEFRDSIIQSLYRKIDRNGPDPVFTHYFVPVKIQNFDYTNFKVKMLNRATLVAEEMNIPFTNKGGFKLDFSTGFIFNGLTNENYAILEKDSAHVELKEINKKMPFNTGVCLMAHAYRRTGCFVNVAATTGLCFNLNNQNLNFMLGASTLWGEDQRFILSAGFVAGRIKELVAYYKKDTPISVNEIPLSGTVPYTDRLKASWFIGISYNLGVGSKSKSLKL